MSKEDIIKDEIFAFLQRRYVQRQDARQKAMGLQYMDAETHDLAKNLANLFSRMAKRLQSDGEEA